MNFLEGLLDGVGDLLQVDLAHDIESIFWHADLPKNCANQPLRVPEEAELTPWNFFFVRFSQSEKVVEIRSEERRVGKECRDKWSAYYWKKKWIIRLPAGSLEIVRLSW